MTGCFVPSGKYFYSLEKICFYTKKVFIKVKSNPLQDKTKQRVHLQKQSLTESCGQMVSRLEPTLSTFLNRILSDYLIKFQNNLNMVPSILI